MRSSGTASIVPILTSLRDLATVEVAYRMFERWPQENFFKYLREEYALDALVDYGVEPEDPNQEVPSPARRALDIELREARAELQRLQAEHGRKAAAKARSAAPHPRATSDSFLTTPSIRPRIRFGSTPGQQPPTLAPARALYLAYRIPSSAPHL